MKTSPESSKLFFPGHEKLLFSDLHWENLLLLEVTKTVVVPVRLSPQGFSPPGWPTQPPVFLLIFLYWFLDPVAPVPGKLQSSVFVSLQFRVVCPVKLIV